ncbi:hypothetical protein PAF17_05715 [Paracoccus sp. Z330]|uniref:Uncharacterized protein n=1 Tax=Paracoccus onchidii TaxID=3017813 RepID=A0ABT4ZCB7_9RHOB|nr:hypothetical protein [Paracoccus onchidii]MDB6177003.1 hypothetical protein [Paracoccus onchidii]
MTFKNISAALTAVAILAGAASATAAPFANERPDLNATAGVAEKTEVTAGTIYRGKELQRRDVDAGREIAVTVIPSSGKIDRSSRGDS